MREKVISTILSCAVAALFLVYCGHTFCAEENEVGVGSIPTTIRDKPVDVEQGIIDEKKAAENGPDAPSGGYMNYEETSFPKQSLFVVLLRLVISMMVITALIYGTIYILRRFASKGSERPENERLMQVIDRTSLDGKRSVYLVKVIDRLMILGVGTENITILGEIRDESIVESVKSTDFSFHLGKIFSKLHAR